MFSLERIMGFDSNNSHNFTCVFIDTWLFDVFALKMIIFMLMFFNMLYIGVQQHTLQYITQMLPAYK